MSYTTIQVDHHDHVSVITLNRPEAMNALSSQMMHEMYDVIHQLDNDDKIRAIVLTGNNKAFAAGADIKEMVDQTYLNALQSEFLGQWDCIANCRTPIIAAVAGYALGGGCEIAMMCDFILAADNAKFGQPEISIGTLPGLGGTQRLTRLVGKSKAMEMCLTGRMMDAEEAERAGLVSRIVPLDDLQSEALKVAQKIAGFSKPAAIQAKECVLAASNTTLDQGMRTERRAFHSLFGTPDQIEGMQAFIDKRKPEFS
jgi:enoyl-CoA hydratase